MKLSAVAARVAPTCALLFAIAGIAHADEGRIQNEEIVIQDPTVANGDNWKFQVGVDAWFVAVPYTVPDPFSGKRFTGWLTGEAVGATGYFSRGDWTLQLFVRPDGVFHDNVANSCCAWTYSAKDRNGEYEARICYLLRDQNWLGFTPYLLAGDEIYTESVNETINVPAREQFETDHLTWNTVEVGLGGIHKFDDRWGLRIDGTVGYATNSWSFNNQYFSNVGHLTGNGLAGTGTVTLYYQATDHLIAQLGGRAMGVSALGWKQGGVGAYASLAYSWGE